MTWQLRQCSLCSAQFEPKREAQTYCSPRCSGKARVARHRSRYIEPALPEKPLQALQPASAGLVEGSKPRCAICGRWQCRPRSYLPRHLFCIAMRKRPQLLRSPAHGRETRLPRRDPQTRLEIPKSRAIHQLPTKLLSSYQ
jgi:hypothetical protein